MVEVESIHDLILEISPYYKKKGKPEAEHTLGYDSSSETLEPLYFFILDLMDSMGLKPEKLVDNFSSSPGSGHFSEIGGKASIMQQQGTKTLADINTVIRSILNLIYDLREIKVRIQTYDDLKDPSKKESAILSLKQIWLDKVDMTKGNSSIAMMARQLGFATLFDSFYAVKETKDIDRLDLNERVKRVLKQRIHEFTNWITQSEIEFRKRYGLEKTYLKSQVSSLKLYSRWAKPYLRAAAQLESKDFGRDPALVKIFNTLLLELTLLGKNKLKIKESALDQSFPEEFSKDKFLRKVKREYYSCILLDFNFRGIPNKVQGTQHYTFGGKVDIVFRAYALNQEEIDLLNKKLEQEDLDSAFGLITNVTDDSLGQLKEDIDFFVGEDQKTEQTRPKDTSNPFLALFGKYESKEKPKSTAQEILEPAQDNWYEREYFRAKSANDAKEILYNIFDVYKKAHGMASFT